MTKRTGRSKALSGAEIERFVAAATELHKACTNPMIDISSEHYRVLQETHRVIVLAVERLTGRSGPWVMIPRPASWESEVAFQEPPG